jgi:AcrR family transcriptional regulator
MKETFAAVLMETLKSKTLDKITVKDLVDSCGVSRQAFYYYFNDIYDIIEWIFLQEAEKVLMENSDINTWQFGYCLLLNWLKKNQALVINTYRSIQRDYVESFMNRVLYPYIIKVVEDQAAGLNVTPKQKEFIARFYTLAFNAISLEWIRNGMQDQPDEIANHVDILVKGDFKKALMNFHNENNFPRA